MTLARHGPRWHGPDRDAGTAATRRLAAALEVDSTLGPDPDRDAGGPIRPDQAIGLDPASLAMADRSGPVVGRGPR